MNKLSCNTATHKRCPRCKQIKLRTEFYKNRNSSSHDGLQGICKVCSVRTVREYHKADPAKHAAYNRQWDKKNPEKKKDTALKTRLGLPAGTYQKMFEQQNGRCAICQKETPGQRLHVDHCKQTGIIRGLLCSCCNTGIGQLQHSEPILVTAIGYLRTFTRS